MRQCLTKKPNHNCDVAAKKRAPPTWTFSSTRLFTVSSKKTFKATCKRASAKTAAPHYTCGALRNARSAKHLTICKRVIARYLAKTSRASKKQQKTSPLVVVLAVKMKMKMRVDKGCLVNRTKNMKDQQNRSRDIGILIKQAYAVQWATAVFAIARHMLFCANIMVVGAIQQEDNLFDIFYGNILLADIPTAHNSRMRWSYAAAAHIRPEPCTKHLAKEDIQSLLPLPRFSQALVAASASSGKSTLQPSSPIMVLPSWR